MVITVLTANKGWLDLNDARMMQEWCKNGQLCLKYVTAWYINYKLKHWPPQGKKKMIESSSSRRYSCEEAVEWHSHMPCDRIPNITVMTIKKYSSKDTHPPDTRYVMSFLSAILTVPHYASVVLWRLTWDETPRPRSTVTPGRTRPATVNYETTDKTSPLIPCRQRPR